VTFLFARNITFSEKSMPWEIPFYLVPYNTKLT